MKLYRFVVVAGLAALSGCGAGLQPFNPFSISAPSTDPSFLWGTWAVRSIGPSADVPAMPIGAGIGSGPGTGPVTSSQQVCPASFSVNGTTFSCTAGETQVFGKDGTFTDTAAGISGTYTFNGQFVTISRPGVPGTINLRPQITDTNVLTENTVYVPSPNDTNGPHVFTVLHRQ